MERPEWSNKQLRKLGETFRDGSEPPHNALSYDEVRRHYSNVAEAGDFFGREIRYGGEPSESEQAHLVRELKALSLDTISAVERHRERLVNEEISIEEALSPRTILVRDDQAQDSRSVELEARRNALEYQYEILRDSERRLMDGRRQLRSEVRKMASRRGESS